MASSSQFPTELAKDWQRPNERETLQPWMAFAIAQKIIYGWTWEEIAAKWKKSRGYMEAIMCSPAAKRFREKVESYVDEPKQLAKLLMEGSSVDLASDWLLALEWAKEDRDPALVHKMVKDMMAVAGVEGTVPQKAIIQINVGGGEASKAFLEAPTIETSFELLEPPDEESG